MFSVFWHFRCFAIASRYLQTACCPLSFSLSCSVHLPCILASPLEVALTEELVAQTLGAWYVLQMQKTHHMIIAFVQRWIARQGVVPWQSHSLTASCIWLAHNTMCKWSMQTSLSSCTWFPWPFWIDRSYGSMCYSFYWLHMHRDLQQAYVKGCPDCQRNKSSMLLQYAALTHESLRNPYRLPVLPVPSLRIPPILLVKSLYSWKINNRESSRSPQLEEFLYSPWEILV
jgi:hypothetical protein